MLAALLAGVIGLVGVIGPVVKKPAGAPGRPVPLATTQPGWFQLENGVQVRAYLGFWRDDPDHPNLDGRPGDAAKIVRIVKDNPAETHLGISLQMKIPREYMGGEMHYRETLTLPSKPRTWDDLNESLRALKVDRTLSEDGRSSTITETMYFFGDERILPIDELPVKNMPTPFVCYDFDAGDPAGKWTIECWLNEAHLGKFEFEVIKGKPGETDVVVVKDEAMGRNRPSRLAPLWLPGPDEKSGAPQEERAAQQKNQSRTSERLKHSPSK